MKKVVALLGTKRKANTYKLLMQIKDLLAENNTELEIIELYKYDIKDCTGCDICVLKGECALKDDVHQIMDALSKANGIILASPVYLQQVSGKIKTFLTELAVGIIARYLQQSLCSVLQPPRVPA